VSVDAETGQTILHCMGELHAEILLYRITNDFRVPANIGEPRVAYREAIQAAAQAEERYSVRAGEKTLFGHVKIELLPDPRGGDARLRSAAGVRGGKADPPVRRGDLRGAPERRGLGAGRGLSDDLPSVRPPRRIGDDRERGARVQRGRGAGLPRRRDEGRR